MPSYDIFFFGALFFLVGVFLASFGVGVWILIITFAAAAAFLFMGLKRNKRFFWLAGLVFLVFAGAFYYTRDDMRFREKTTIPFGEKTVFSGIIVSNPILKSSSQEFKLELDSYLAAPKGPLRGNILVKTARYPQFGYGDELKIKGTIELPFSESYGRYLSKEGISGVISFAEAEKTGSGHGSGIKASLFAVKNKMVESFQAVLPPKESALLAGLTLGERGEFSESFKEAMSKSGTTHLVALSGYNITIIASTLAALFLWFSIKRRLTFFFTVLVILGFVFMTGAEASVVRAAIMGILVILANEIGRFFDFRNAIILAGLTMVFHNPKVLVFDVGFQLSFLALLGIIYLRPAAVKFFRISEEKGFLSWRENLLTTASAQLMVAPLLVSNFGNFSLTSFVANVVILEFIPVTMGLGFVMTALSFVSYNLALALSLLAQVLLKFEIFVIEFFAKIGVFFSPSAGLASFIVYYLILVGFIYYVGRYVGGPVYKSKRA
ncbi:MAG: ComEC/Rec2 family competence protein [Candidatus Jorgensenbacteria bacterium]